MSESQAARDREAAILLLRERLSRLEGMGSQGESDRPVPPVPLPTKAEPANEPASGTLAAVKKPGMLLALFGLFVGGAVLFRQTVRQQQLSSGLEAAGGVSVHSILLLNLCAVAIIGLVHWASKSNVVPSDIRDGAAAVLQVRCRSVLCFNCSIPCTARQI